MTLAENIEVVNLKAMAGEYRPPGTPHRPAELPVVLENRDRGKYDVHLDLAFNGADTTLHVDMDFRSDPVIGKLLGAGRLPSRPVHGHRPRPDERDLLARPRHPRLGRPGRDACRRTPAPSGARSGRRSTSPPPTSCSTASASPRRTARASACAPTTASAVTIELLAVKAFMDWPKHAEMIARRWRKIGIYGDVKEAERGLAFRRLLNSDHHIFVWTNGGTELLYLYSTWCLPTDISNGAYGIEHAKWYASNGARAPSRPTPKMLEALELFRSAAGKQEAERNKIGQEIWKIIVDQQFQIGTCGQSPGADGRASRQPAVWGDIPGRTCIAQRCRTPGSSPARDVVLQADPNPGGGGAMISFLLRRLLLGVLTIWLISILSVRDHPVPAGPTSSTPTSRASPPPAPRSPPRRPTLRKLYGLGQPVYVQYAQVDHPHRHRRSRQIHGVAAPGRRGDRRSHLAGPAAPFRRADADLGPRAADRASTPRCGSTRSATTSSPWWASSASRCRTSCWRWYSCT
jgi:hypothetical protein